MKKVSVLIVDDNKTDRYLLKRFLKKCDLDFVVNEAEDGQYGLDFFEDFPAKRARDPVTYPPQIVFLDINMPRVNGFEFLAGFSALQAEHDLTESAVVMVTSSPNQSDRDRAAAWDCVKGYQIKGDFNAAKLQDLVCGLLSQGPDQTRLAG